MGRQFFLRFFCQTSRRRQKAALGRFDQRKGSAEPKDEAEEKEHGPFYHARAWSARLSANKVNGAARFCLR
jgi:hypothetical protein